ncbi:translation initiation factor eIF3a [Mycena floridula]|nr:translation initiation factor eIF3a [Mycena floridula]
MAPFSKPETVLKQAEGLVAVGQTHAALQSLTEMFSSKRFRSTPLASLEPIMLRFIELCVDLRKGRTAKEGLMQYKNIAQNSSVGSIEVVVTRFISLADAKVREAQEKSAAATTINTGGVDVDDLEASETPESILLGAVSGDQSKDRTDRALVTPWLKFLWESYRTSLETLKNNARLEAIYQQIAQQAFKFCLTYSRKLEFKRLCETLRLHLSNVTKYSHQPHSINLSDPDTLQHHLDTRFSQLNASVELELWQEAFRSVEDVHNLLTLAKRPPKASVMANYYEKLTKIFLMSGNALFHAAAWGRYYSVVSSIGGKSDEEMARLAGQVMVSALAVPVGLQDELGGAGADESSKGKNGRLTALLGLTKMPTRTGLLKDALLKNVLGLSSPTVKSLYNLLEVRFDPLSLCSNIAPLLLALSNTAASSSSGPSYAPYLPLLHRALLSRLLSHLSQVYSSITLTSLFALIAPLKEAGVEHSYDDIMVESYVMGCARRGEMNVRVDHQAGAVWFIDEGFGSSDEAGSIGLDGGSVQPSTTDLVRKRLGNLAICLHNSLNVIEGHEPTTEKDKKTLKKKAESERTHLHLASLLTARRRELLSELSLRAERAALAHKTEQSRKEAEDRAKKEREDAKRREDERRARERDEIREMEKKKYAKTLVDTGVIKSTEIDKLADLDTSSLLEMQLKSLEKEKASQTQKLRLIGKKVDHTERAYRIVEQPLLETDYLEQQKSDLLTFKTAQSTLHETSQQKHTQDLDAKKRLARIMDDYMKRKEEVTNKRLAEFQKRKATAQKKCEEEKAKRRAAFVAAQQAEAKKQAEAEEARRREEAEQQRLLEEEEARLEAEREEEEERIRAAEEVKRIEEEKAAALRKQREADRAARDEQAKLQQKREQEAEARAAERAAARERERLAARAPAAAVPSSRLNGTRDTGGDVWRRGSGTPANSLPPTPTRASNFATATPPRAESPSPAVMPKYRPGALGGGAGGGWRQKEEAKAAGGPRGGAATPVRSQSPAPPKEETKVVDDDGFQTVAKPSVWKPRRGGRP